MAKSNMGEVVLAKKSGKIIVTSVGNYTEIEVWTKNGNLESVEHVYAGDLVATRITDDGKPFIDGFGHKNSWKISEEILRKKYFLGEETDDQDKLFDLLKQGGVILVGTPKGGVQRFVKLIEDTVFMKPWGENGALVPQTVKAGGWANVTDPSDVYGIAAEEFAETYEIVDVPKTIHKITIGNIGFYKDGFPVAELVCDGEVVNTLVPVFRGYRSQVDGNVKLLNHSSNGDYGSTPVIGFNNLFDARLGTGKEYGGSSNCTYEGIKMVLFEGQIREAIRLHLERRNELLDYTSENNNDYYVFEDTECDVDLGDGRRLPWYSHATRVDLLAAYAVRYMNPELYMAYTVPTEYPYKTIAERIEEYKTEIEDPKLSDDDKKYRRKWIKELEDHQKYLDGFLFEGKNQAKEVV